MAKTPTDAATDDQGGAPAPPARLDVEAEAQRRQERYDGTDSAELAERLRDWADHLDNIDGRALLRATARRLDLLEGQVARAAKSHLTELGTIHAAQRAEKVRTDRLRRVAERQGYRLERNRRRDPQAVDYGTFRILDATGVPACTTAEGGHWLSPFEAEAFLQGTSGEGVQR